MDPNGILSINDYDVRNNNFSCEIVGYDKVPNLSPYHPMMSVYHSDLDEIIHQIDNKIKVSNLDDPHEHRNISVLATCLIRHQSNMNLFGYVSKYLSVVGVEWAECFFRQFSETTIECKMKFLTCKYAISSIRYLHAFLFSVGKFVTSDNFEFIRTKLLSVSLDNRRISESLYIECLKLVESEMPFEFKWVNDLMCIKDERTRDVMLNHLYRSMYNIDVPRYLSPRGYHLTDELMIGMKCHYVNRDINLEFHEKYGSIDWVLFILAHIQLPIVLNTTKWINIALERNLYGVLRNLSFHGFEYTFQILQKVDIDHISMTCDVHKYIELNEKYCNIIMRSPQKFYHLIAKSTTRYYLESVIVYPIFSKLFSTYRNVIENIVPVDIQNIILRFIARMIFFKPKLNNLT